MQANGNPHDLPERATNAGVTTIDHRQETYQKEKLARKQPSAKSEGSLEFKPVLDGRKQPIRNLCIRGDRFYARLTVEDATGKKQVRRIPLVDDQTKEPVTTVTEAKTALNRLRVQRQDNTLPVLKRTPKFSEYVADYFQFHEKVKDAKRPATIAKERGQLNLWQQHLGETRLDRITRAQINSFIAERQSQGISGRTVNLDVIALRNVLKMAIDDGWIKTLPTVNLRPLKHTTQKRSLVASEDIEKLCTAATHPTTAEVALKKGVVLEKGYQLKNAQQFADYIRLMAYCGSRRCETLRLKWKDVNWDRKQLTIGSDGLAKNHESRVVDFNTELEAHLRAMHARRDPLSEYLFPSPQRGEQDIPAKTFKESLKLAQAIAGMPHFGFHDCRHFFISHCVMSGIDYMTIARWVGHKDGGVLIGKVYGHLSNEHARHQAQKLGFVAKSPAPAGSKQSAADTGNTTRNLQPAPLATMSVCPSHQVAGSQSGATVAVVQYGVLGNSSFVSNGEHSPVSMVAMAQLQPSSEPWGNVSLSNPTTCLRKSIATPGPADGILGTGENP